jgi:predicted ATPase/DNA-binding XRE family transcriptional regulator
MSVAHARSFGELLKHHRLMAGLSQEDLAARAGLSRRGISDLERGVRRAPRPSTLALLAEALGLAAQQRAALFAAARGLILLPLPDDQRADSTGSAAELETTYHLPIQPTPFVGRRRELALLQRLLDAPDSRLLTLVGPGGSGKTRLAIEAAHTNSAAFAHGAHFVSLASAGSADTVLFAIGDVLGCPFDGQAAPAVQLAAYLRDKTLLLVLDNVEHLLDAAAVLADLLAATPDLKLLVTSRERLTLQGEWVVPLDGLDYPATADDDDFESYSAVQLFVQSAQRVQPDFALQGKAPDVLRICQLVEGMPLALELAAAWARLLPCAQIVQQLESSLDFLAAPLRNVPARHRSLRAVFDQSWTLLNPAEQTALAKLSVFRGTIDLEAAQEVGGTSLALLASLVDKSLIHVDGRAGYALHDLLRRHAADHLAQQADAAGHQERAITYLTVAAERASQAGVQRKAAGFLGQAIAIAEAAGKSDLLADLHHKRGHALSQVGMWVEAHPELVAALAAARPEDVDQRVRILLELSDGVFYLYDVAAQRQHVMEPLAQAEAAQRDDLVVAATVKLGPVEANDGNLREALRLYERTIAKGGDAHPDFGLTLYWLGRYTDAVDHLRRTLALVQVETADQLYQLQDLGLALAGIGQYAEAVQVFEQARQLSQKHEVWPLLARSVSVMAGFHLDLFDYAGSEALAKEARALARSAEFVLAEVSAGLDLLFSLVRRKEVERAAQLADEVSATVEKARGSHAWLFRLRFTQARAELALAREDWPEAQRLAETAIQQSRAAGRVKYEALALKTRAQALAALGRTSEATGDLRHAQEVIRPTGDPALFLQIAAAMLAVEGDDALAQEAYATAQRIRAALPTDEMRHIFDAAEPVRQIARLVS